MSNSHSEANISKLCLVCKDMFGNPTFKDMCSKCFKESKMKSELLKQIVFHKEEQKIEHEEWKEEKKQEEINLKEESRDEKESMLSILKEKRPEKIPEEERPKKETNKCNICKKKVGILGYECKNCTSTFCKFHRLPEEHSCDVDFIEIGKKKLERENPLVAVAKIEKF